MIQSTQLIYICKHIITDAVNTYSTDIITRNYNSDTDIICSGFIIGNIYCVYSAGENGKKKYYYENIDFKKVASDTIIWIGVKPADNVLYTIEYIKIKKTIITYTQKDCPQCNGNGWYVDLMSVSDSNMAIVTGPDKIIQDFIKLLLTDSTDGTVDITTVMKATSTSEIIQDISNFVKKCEDTYIDRQLLIISGGISLSDSETLIGIDINEIDYDKDLCAYYVSLTIKTKSGETIDIGLKV